MSWQTEWKARAAALKYEVIALWLACRDPRTPWYAKALAICVTAYALSPIDLIPDPIPLLGQLDDLILVPLGVLLVRRLMPPDVLADCRRRAKATDKPSSGWGAVIVVLIWLVTLGMSALWLWQSWG